MATSLLSWASPTLLRPIRQSFPHFHQPSRNFRSVTYASKIRANYVGENANCNQFAVPSTRFGRCNSTAPSGLGVTASSGLHSLATSNPVVSADWLHANLKEPDVKVIDASWYMPGEQRNPLQEYQVAHIPGALFFDVDGISDRTSDVPHMLPSEEAFSAAVSALGIYNKDDIIVNDGKGIFSSARVWRSRPFSTNSPQSTINNTKTPTSTWDPQVVEWNKAIARHMRRGNIGHAQHLFDQMPKRTISSYNTMLSGYILNSHYAHAISLFSRMASRDIISYNTMLHCHICNCNHGHLETARRMFDHMPLKDGVSYNTMISAYARRGLVDQAKELFDQAPLRNNISWNGLLAAYLQNGRFELAKELFQSKPDWDVVSWNAIIGGYVQRKQMDEARNLFDKMPHKDSISWNTMITGYAQSGNMVESRKLFDIMPLEKDVFTWTALVSGYAKNANLEEARGFFEKMPERNIVSWNAMVAAYVQNRQLNEAKNLFDQMPSRDEITWNTMLTAYANAGMIKEGREMFDKMAHRDPVSWSAMLTAYTQVGLSEEALCLFIEMSRRGIKANRSAFARVLLACADMAMLECGTQLHAQLFKAGYGMGCFVGNTLLALYFKCGSMEDAHKAFYEMHEKDTASWNTMISGYGRHGFGSKALEIFELMKQTRFRPDDITLVGVLSACSHTGLVDKGISLFHSMEQIYGITPTPAHYTCVIDLLGRAGRLKEALALIEEMSFEPDPTTWGALLGASRVHREPEIGKRAAEKILELEPSNSGMYVLLSNIYASYGKWTDVQKTRVLMGERGVRKVPGFSWIEVNNKLHIFSVGDSTHPDKGRIYQYLEELDLELKRAGYVSTTEMVLHDIEEEEKVHMLRYHSERLAVAFGILNVPLGRPVRVIKNLRVCEDCHNAIKYVSKIENRLIILRDSNRFHHFSGGSCSCGDYW